MPKKRGGKARPMVGRAKSNYSARTGSAPTRNPDAGRIPTGPKRRTKKRGGK